MRKPLPQTGTTRIITRFAYFPRYIHLGKITYKIWLEKYKVLQIYEDSSWSDVKCFLLDTEITDVDIKEAKELVWYPD